MLAEDVGLGAVATTVPGKMVVAQVMGLLPSPSTAATEDLIKVEWSGLQKAAIAGGLGCLSGALIKTALLNLKSFVLSAEEDCVSVKAEDSDAKAKAEQERKKALAAGCAHGFTPLLLARAVAAARTVATMSVWMWWRRAAVWTRLRMWLQNGLWNISSSNCLELMIMKMMKTRGMGQ